MLCFAFKIIFIYICAHVGLVCVGVYRGQKRALVTPELALRAVVSWWMWVLGTKPRSSGRATGLLTALSHLYSPETFIFEVWS